MQMCVCFVLYLFLATSKKKYNFLWGMDALALLYFVKIWELQVRRIVVCGYGYGWEISYPRQAWC